MAEEVNQIEETQELTEAAAPEAGATLTPGNSAPQELVIPENWEQPIKDFINGDTFAKDINAKKAFFEKFKSLDDGYQAKFNDFTKKNKAFEEREKSFKESERFLNSYKDFEKVIPKEDMAGIMSRFSSMQGYLTKLYQLDKQYTQDPLGFIHGLMQTSNITPDILAKGIQSPEYQKQLAERNKTQELGNLRQEVEAKVRAELEADRFKQKVLAFVNEKDEAGALKHPHINTVYALMDSFLSANPALSLEDAYTNACYASPEIRAQLLQEQEQAKIKQAEVEKAKKAQGITTAPKKASPTQNKNWQTVLDDLIENDAMPLMKD